MRAHRQQGGCLQQDLSRPDRRLLAAREVVITRNSNPTAFAGETAHNGSLDPKRLQRWVDHLQQAATNQMNPLHCFARLALNRAAEAPGRLQEMLATNRPPTLVDLPADARVIADYSRPEHQPWKVDGEAFGARPLRPGDIVPGNDGTNLIAHVMTYGAARRDLFWN